MPERIAPELARRIRLAAFDVDGVLTDGGVYLGQTASGEAVEMKRFSITDGLGLKLLAWSGVEVALVSGRESAATALRAAELELACVQVSGGYKLDRFQALLEDRGVSWEDAAFLGDDLPDVPILRRVGLPAVVANALPEARHLASWHSDAQGGQGAAREFAEALLRARGEWDGLVADYCRERGDDGV